MASPCGCARLLRPPCHSPPPVRVSAGPRLKAAGAAKHRLATRVAPGENGSVQHEAARVAPSRTAFRGLPWLTRANAIRVAGAVAAFSAVLWPQWLHDENLSHGIFLPVLACILVVESRRDCAPRFARSGAGALAACALLALASLGSLTVAVVYSEAVGWSHAVTEFMLSGSACPLPWARRGSRFADRRVRFVPLNWPAGVAVTLWLFAGPPPPGTYARFALLLQGVVTGGVVRIFSALGLAAYQNGNVIELARTRRRGQRGLQRCPKPSSRAPCCGFVPVRPSCQPTLATRARRGGLPRDRAGHEFSAIPPAYAACECRCQHRGPLA